MKTYLIYDKKTGLLVDSVQVESDADVLEDYDYSKEFFDIKVAS